MLKAVFAVLLLLSLAGKVVWSSAAPQPDELATARSLTDMLRGAGFQARLVERLRAPHAVVHAALGDCRLVAGDYPAHGTFLDLYQNLGNILGELRFARRGALTAAAPKLGALLDFYLWREQRRIGVTAARTPVIAVAATPDCALESLPWTQTAIVSA